MKIAHARVDFDDTHYIDLTREADGWSYNYGLDDVSDMTDTLYSVTKFLSDIEGTTPEYYKREGLPECKELIKALLSDYDLSSEEYFYLGNVIKYLYRAPLKDGKEDLKKAEVYLAELVK